LKELVLKYRQTLFNTTQVFDMNDILHFHVSLVFITLLI